MGNLMSQFKEIMAKDKDLAKSGGFVPSYSTGFDIFDHVNGYKNEENELELGIDGGKIITFVGKSGTGKTTLAVQMASYIVSKFENSNVLHIDIERATKKIRVMNINRWKSSYYDEKYEILDTNINAESVFKTIKKYADLKIQLKDEISIPSGKFDAKGKEIMILPPTIVLLDSLALLAPKNIDEQEEFSGQMSATSVAKANTQLFKRVVGPLKDSNIIFMVINHINTKVDINPMAKTQSQVNFLKQDETLPGGNAPIYLSNYLLKLVSSKKLKADEGFGVKGFEVNVELVKSRSAAAGLFMTLIFDQVKGFNNTLSNYNFLKDLKLIKGAGRSYYIDECPDVKWSQKEFLTKYNENAKLRKAFDKLVEENLYAIVPDNIFESEYDEDALESEEDGELTWDEDLECYVDDEGNQYDEDGNPLEEE